MDKKTATDLGYNETSDKITTRIEAHKKYSNFSLDSWLEDKLPWKKGQAILDIGCGGGNFFQVYSSLLGETGLIVGMDKSAQLLKEAAEKETLCHKILMEIDINSDYHLTGELFDFVISTFAIYYADNPEETIKKIFSILKPGGGCCLIGPTAKNAGELYTFNKTVFGFDSYQKVDQRTTRLESFFLPAVAEIFAHARHEIIGSRLVFPSKEEYVNYYCATLLFEESSRISNNAPLFKELLNVELHSLEISKEMIAIWGIK